MPIREGAWDCPACGREGNAGPAIRCSGCGFPRGPEVPIYLPEDARQVDDPEALQRALAGADWSCPYCGGDNPAGAAHCAGCSAPRQAAPQRAVTDLRGPLPPGKPRLPPSPVAAVSSSPPERPDKKRRQELRRAYKRGRKSSRRRLVLGCLGITLLAALLLAWCPDSGTGPETATVTGFSWQRVIAVEAAETVVERAPAGRLPPGARELDPARSGRTRTVTERVQVGTERVQVGVRDLGNGYFEEIYEDRPVYEMRRRQVPVTRIPGQPVPYEIDHWRPVRERVAAGVDREPAWPTVELAAGEREGERRQLYRVHLSGRDGRKLVYTTGSESEWRRYRPGESHRVEATASGRVRRVLP